MAKIYIPYVNLMPTVLFGNPYSDKKEAEQWLRSQVGSDLYDAHRKLEEGNSLTDLDLTEEEHELVDYNEIHIDDYNILEINLTNDLLIGMLDKALNKKLEQEG